MNYVPFHLNDYAEATAHLSYVEDAAYMRLLRKYYVQEGPFPDDLRAIIRLVAARTEEEREAVETVLNEFFDFVDGQWHHTRCDEEIAKYLDKKRKAAESVNSRWSKHRRNADVIRGEQENDTNVQNNDTNVSKPDTDVIHTQEPIANSQEPITKGLEKRSRGSRLQTDSLPDDWLEFAKEKRPDLDPLETFAAFRDYWVGVAGSKGVKADWPATWRNWVRGQNTKRAPPTRAMSENERYVANRKAAKERRLAEEARTINAG